MNTENLSPVALAASVSNILSETKSAEELGSVVKSIFNKPLTDEQFSVVVNEVFSKTLIAKELYTVLEAVFSNPISDEKFSEVISKVLEKPLDSEQFAAVVDVLENKNITSEQVSKTIDKIVETGINEEQATKIATSEKILHSINGEQASQIFNAIEISSVTPEDAEEIVSAVQEAPKEVRSSFEKEINVFDGVVDNYVPLGSSVDVSTRRVVIAAVAAASSISFTPAPSPAQAPSGNSGVSGFSENKTSNSRRRK